MADDDKKAEVYLYDLTRMTGRGAQAGRPVVFLTLEMRRGTLIATVVSAFPALIVTGMLFPLLGMWALMVGMVVFAVLMGILRIRQRRGLQLAQWRGWVDKRRSRTDVFVQCNRVIEPAQSSVRTVIRSARPNPLRAQHDDDALTDGVLAL